MWEAHISVKDTVNTENCGKRKKDPEKGGAANA